MLSLVTAVPEVTAAAALSAGSLGAFAPPPGLARLVTARDNDAEAERAGVAATAVVPEGGDVDDDLVALGPDRPPRRSRPCFDTRFGRGSEARCARAPLQSRERHRHHQWEQPAMCRVTFKLVAADEARILADDQYVGDLYRHPDILSPGKVFFVVHLEDDPRGPCRVHERHRIREVVAQRIRTHPFGP